MKLKKIIKALEVLNTTKLNEIGYDFIINDKYEWQIKRVSDGEFYTIGHDLETLKETIKSFLKEKPKPAPKFYVGQTVYFHGGKFEISEFNSKKEYPIELNDGSIFSIDGKLYIQDIEPSLLTEQEFNLWQEFKKTLK